jgi:uncharacterized membrane protein YhaH (DUF805 family)
VAISIDLKSQFSLEGRMSARDYRRLILRLTYLSAGIIVVGIFIVVQGLRFAGYVTAVLVLLLWLANGAAFVRRLHDRNRKGWWIVLSIAAYFMSYYLETLKLADTNLAMAVIALQLLVVLVSLWLLVELYIRRGTPGANRFGPDPLQL